MVTQSMLRTYEGKQVVSETTFIFTTDLEPNKCLDQIKLPILPHTCTPISEIQSNHMDPDCKQYDRLLICYNV